MTTVEILTVKSILVSLPSNHLYDLSIYYRTQMGVTILNFLCTFPPNFPKIYEYHRRYNAFKKWGLLREPPCRYDSQRARTADQINNDCSKNKIKFMYFSYFRTKSYKPSNNNIVAFIRCLGLTMK